MWNRQNEYNSPSAQMSRFKEAGLNPNLIYGQGSSGNATQLPKYSAPTVEYKYRPLELDTVMSNLGAYMDLQTRSAQVDNIKAMTENTRARTANEAIEGALKSLGVGHRQFDLSQKLSLEKYSQEIVKRQATQALQAINQNVHKEQILSNEAAYSGARVKYANDKFRLENENVAAENVFKQFRNSLRDYGVTDSDNILVRLLVRTLSNAGIDLYNLGK